MVRSFDISDLRLLKTNKQRLMENGHENLLLYLVVSLNKNYWPPKITFYNANILLSSDQKILWLSLVNESNKVFGFLAKCVVVK